MNNLLASFLGIAVGAALTAISTLIVNQVSYKHEYYKMVIEKRLHAYNNIEHLVNNIKSIGLDAIVKAVNRNDLDFLRPLKEEIKTAKSEKVWLSKEMKKALDELEWLLLSFEMENYNQDRIAIQDGEKLYSTINSTTKTIEGTIKTDMLSMHRVEKFLRNK